MKLMSPKDIQDKLDAVIIGQNDVKRDFSYTIFKHMLRILYREFKDKDEKFKKNNHLIIGPSGCGKTLMIETASAILGLPICVISAKDLTNSGYKGSSIKEHLSGFYKHLGGNQKALRSMENAIIFVDEFDKICEHGQTTSTGDNWNESLQHTLLKVMEDSTINLEDARTDRENGPKISTANMLFVFAGSFSNMIKKRGAVKQAIGFNSHTNNKATTSLHEELMSNGVIKEIAGRISTVSEIKPLTKDELKLIITTAEGNVYQQTRKLLEFAGINFQLTEEQIDNIVDTAYITKTGARGLQTAIEDLSKSVCENAVPEVDENIIKTVFPDAEA